MWGNFCQSPQKGPYLLLSAIFVCKCLKVKVFRHSENMGTKMFVIECFQNI